MRLFLAGFLICFCSIAHADINRTIENAVSTDTLTSINVPGTTVVYTKSISLTNQDLGDIGVMYKATSNGIINLSIQAQRSYARPSTEAVDNATYIEWKNPSVASDSAWHAATLDTVVMPFMRFKITGGSGND